MAQNSQSDFICQIQAFSVIFQIIHNPEALLVVTEGLAQADGQCRFPCMAKGGVAQVVAHGDGFCQIFVESQRPGHGPGNPGHLQGVGHAGAVVVSLGAEEYLGLVHQTAKCFAVNDSVVVALVTGSHIVLTEKLLPGTAGALVGKGCQRIQTAVLLIFQFLFHCHGTQLLN